MKTISKNITKWIQWNIYIPNKTFYWLLLRKIYKTKNSFAPAIMHHLSQFRENIFNLRNFRKLVTLNKKTSNYGLETAGYRTRFLLAKLLTESKKLNVGYRTRFLLAKLLYEYKKLTSLSEFKTNIKNWKGGEICPCRLCEYYLPKIRYMLYQRST